MHRIHIVGVSQRTGTTLLAECMRICFDIQRYEKHEASIRILKFTRGVYLTKKPPDLLYIYPRLMLDARLDVICMMRDPRDTIVSRHGKNPERYYKSIADWKLGAAKIREIRHHPRFHIVKYEDLVGDPDEVQSQLASQMPYLRTVNKFSEFYKAGSISDSASVAMGGVRPIDTQSVGNWRSHVDRIKEQIRNNGSFEEELIEFGYENDSSWIENIGVVRFVSTGTPQKMRQKRWAIRQGLGWFLAGFAWVCDRCKVPLG